MCKHCCWGRHCRSPAGISWRLCAVAARQLQLGTLQRLELSVYDLILEFLEGKLEDVHEGVLRSRMDGCATDVAR